MGTKLLFAAGLSLGYNLSDLVQIYDVETGLWTTARLSRLRYRMAIATVGTKAIFAGGVAYGGGPSDAVDIYDSATGVWSTATLSQPRSYLAGTALGTRALFAGGGTGPFTVTSHVDIYDAATGQWSTAELSQPRARPAAATVGDRAIFAGGEHRDEDGMLVISAVVDLFSTDPARTATPTATPTTTQTPTRTPTVTATATTVGGTVLRLQAGWNLIALRDRSASYSAAEVCRALNAAGGTGTALEVVRWHDGGWIGHICGLAAEDFQLDGDSGYFVRVSRPLSWTP